MKRKKKMRTEQKVSLKPKVPLQMTRQKTSQVA